jgi:hypothetical protein
MRVLPSAGAAALAVAASVLFAPTAFANVAAAGDNGTIKIHDAKTGEDLVKDEPHVCSFYLDAFFFDGLQNADWKIVDMPPTGSKEELASSGAIPLDGDGHGRSADMTLPDGHYKLVWNFDGENGEAKHKVFWTDCTGDDGTPTPTGTGTATPTGTPTGTATPTGDGTATPTSPGATGGTVTDPASSASPSAAGAGDSDSSGGNLASTGASVIGISGAAAVLLAVGAAVRFRRRGTRAH